MKRTTTILAAILSTTLLSNAQVVISDNYNVVGNGTGFGNNTGVNTDIATRLTGTAAAGLQYANMNAKGGAQYSITDNKLRGNGNNQIGAFTLSADGTTGFDFGSALGSTTATPANPVVYEIAITMANNLTGGPRFSFGLMTTTPSNPIGSAGLWDFGVQLDRAGSDNTAYDVFGRIDEASRTVVGDANFLLQTKGANSYGTEVSVLLRVTDAGAETEGFNSRVEVSLDGGNSFIYNTDSDGGFRFDDSGRYFMWDFASNGGTGDRGYGTYDEFSVTIVPEPSTIALAGIGGAALLLLGRRARKSRK